MSQVKKRNMKYNSKTDSTSKEGGGNATNIASNRNTQINKTPTRTRKKNQ